MRTINVSLDEEAYFDAIYFSPHKFVGGPGSSGLLLIHEAIYRRDLAPTVGAGGTVNFVDFTGQDYSDDVEVREKPGTPGILQIMRASLAMELLERMDPERIAVREDELVGRALERLDHPAIEILGPLDPARRIAIVSFNLREGDSYLHPRFVTLLLNDLFGIQSRAGCSCAGPYGHRMLHLDTIQSAALRERIHRGVLGLRPGWVRVNFHFLMTDEEAEFLIDAILFVAGHGRYFLPSYTFDVRTGAWTYRAAAGSTDGSAPGALASDAAVAPTAAIVADASGDAAGCGTSFGLAEALRLGVAGGPGAPSVLAGFAVDGSAAGTGPGPDAAERASIERRRGYLREARRLAGELRASKPDLRLRCTKRDLIPFVYA